jgi:hypothetical protein
MKNISFEEFKTQVVEEIEIAELKTDIPSNDVSEYEDAVDEWNCLYEILYNIEGFEEEARLNNALAALEVEDHSADNKYKRRI